MTTIQTTSCGQYLTQPGCIALESRELSPLQPDEVQVAVRSTTICGSDLHYFVHGRNGTIVPKEPLCLGHESAGEIIAVGSEVKDVKLGDRIAIESGVPCSHCAICNEGRYNLCPTLRFRGSGSAFPHFQGMFQEYIIHPSRWIHKLPAPLTYEDGALLEPLAVAIHAVRRAQMHSRQTCLIFGAGAVGLLCAAAARHAGSGTIVMADIDEGRLAFAKENGFADLSYTVQPRKSTSIDEKMATARDVAGDIHALLSKSADSLERPARTFECTGVEACVQASIFVTRSGGKVLLVGMGTPNHTLPISEASAREIDLLPTWRYANCYPDAIKLVELAREGTAGIPDITKLVTHHFEGLGNVTSALRTAGTTRDAKGALVIKVAVNF